MNRATKDLFFDEVPTGIITELNDFNPGAGEKLLRIIHKEKQRGVLWGFISVDRDRNAQKL
jgi:hypothetical protein